MNNCQGISGFRFLVSSFWLYFFFILFTWILSFPAYARVLLTEVSPAPSTGNPEWIEIYNDATTSADLTGWVLKDQLTAPSTLYTFSSLEKDSFLLEPETYSVITLPTAKLNNSADGVTLIDESGEIRDQMSYTSSQTDQTWSWDPINQLWIECAPTPSGELLTECITTTEPSPSPSALPTPSPTTQPTYSLSLSEIYAAPNSGETEWIEIFNDSSGVVAFDSLKIIDQSNNKKTIDQVILNPHSYTVISWSGSLLNNDGDSISIVDSLGRVLLTEVFDACDKGRSLIKVDGVWTVTGLPTPGEGNQVQDQDDDKTVESEESVKNQEESLKTKEENFSSEISPSTQQTYLPDQYLSGVVLGSSTSAQPASHSNSLNFDQPVDDPQSPPSLEIFTQLALGGLSWITVGGWNLWKHLKAFETTQIHL